MRTIKFRGKRVDNGEWVYGSYVAYWQHNYDGEPNIVHQICDGDGDSFNIHPDTVGQSTGLFDKNGKEIYEGDVITSDEIHTRVVRWNSYECKFNAVEWGIHTAIILGNIYDNPELLKSDLK